MKFLRRVINNVDLILPDTDVCIALHTQCFPSVCEKNFTGDSGGIQTHDLLLTRADVLTSRPPSLPDDDWSARIVYSRGLMKFLRRVINNIDLILPYSKRLIDSYQNVIVLNRCSG